MGILGVNKMLLLDQAAQITKVRDTGLLQYYYCTYQSIDSFVAMSL